MGPEILIAAEAAPEVLAAASAAEGATVAGEGAASVAPEASEASEVVPKESDISKLQKLRRFLDGQTGRSPQQAERPKEQGPDERNEVDW